MDKIVEPPTAVEMEQTEDGKVVLRGVVVRCDAPTLTGRVYPRAVVERAIAARQESVRCGSFLAVCPATPGGRVHIADVAGVVRKLELDGDARAEVLLVDSLAGKTILEFVKEKHPLRFFSMGRGSIAEVDGVQVVQDDFIFDGVGIAVED
jgi:hypothetical protein